MTGRRRPVGAFGRPARIGGRAAEQAGDDRDRGAALARGRGRRDGRSPAAAAPAGGWRGAREPGAAASRAGRAVSWPRRDARRRPAAPCACRCARRRARASGATGARRAARRALRRSARARTAFRAAAPPADASRRAGRSRRASCRPAPTCPGGCRPRRSCGRPGVSTRQTSASTSRGCSVGSSMWTSRRRSMEPSGSGNCPPSTIAVAEVPPVGQCTMPCSAGIGR